jgi:glycosyltransferase involved in cell wall biosynthesis
MQRYEGTACRRFDAVVAVSVADREMMRKEFELKEVYDVPTGVDTEYFTSRGEERDPFGLVFTGSMDWMPNEDAILYFAEEILPRISKLLPPVTLTVVGRNPSKRIQSLAAANPRIKITGRVDDVRPYVDRASAYIVPLRIGGGTRLKIYEAMAMRKPVISTSIGAEGLPVRDGEELLIADTAEEFVQAMVRTLTDKAFAAKISEQARSVVCEQFGWNRAAEEFSLICERAANQRTKRHAA